MTKSIEVSGRTEEDAIELALEQLGLTRDDVSVEILERAKSGFLGIKNTPALVKVMYEATEERTERVESFLKGLFERMGVDVGMDITESDSAIDIALTGKEPGALIGRRGETLDAVQHITNYVINRGSSGRIRVNLDAENYRQRRNETLESLAVRTAEKVQKYRRNMSLDPMNAYERHIVHSALQEYENVSTYSIGTEPNRRIVVAYGRSGSERHEGSDRRSSQGGGRGGSGYKQSGSKGGYGSPGSGRGGESNMRSNPGGGRGNTDRNADSPAEKPASSETAPYREWS